MWEGKVVAIHVRNEKAQPTAAVDVAVLTEGQGIQGDHIAESQETEGRRQVTLIEEEAFAQAAREYDVDITHSESRRNILTRGVPLNHLVGQTFRVGNCMLRGLDLCEPCGHLQKLTGQNVVKAFRHRGGLRAEIVRGGEIRSGDTVALASE